MTERMSGVLSQPLNTSTPPARQRKRPIYVGIMSLIGPQGRAGSAGEASAVISSSHQENSTNKRSTKPCKQFSYCMDTESST